ncbi:hypothetical protein ANO11243_012130 [Dothideomycetidae sp. 11243]|nr:hypothetical protein ANO11243_012130 [fungal sp. No.11243]
MATTNNSNKKTIVLITGGNAGIGYETVKSLCSSHAATHHILLSARSMAKAEAAISSLGSPANVTPLQLDVSDDASISAAAEEVTRSYGRLDVLIHNAGIASRPVAELSTRAKFETVYNTNTIGPYVLTEAMEELLDKSAEPRVVFVSSTLGSIALTQEDYPCPPIPWYSSSKAAMNYLAAYYARMKPKWHSNAVCPGLNATALNGLELTDELHPRNGAIIVARMAADPKATETGKFLNREKTIVW